MSTNQPDSKQGKESNDGFSLVSLTETFQGSTSFVISTAAFGAALFSLVLNQIRDPRDAHPTARFSLDTVRVFLALAWLSLALCLTVVGFSLTFLKVLSKTTTAFHRSPADDSPQEQQEKKQQTTKSPAAAPPGTLPVENGVEARKKSREEKRWHGVGLLVWALLYALITLAFALLSLVLVAYVGAVGWVALGFACLVGILSVVWFILEARVVFAEDERVESHIGG